MVQGLGLSIRAVVVVVAIAVLRETTSAVIIKNVSFTFNSGIIPGVLF